MTHTTQIANPRVTTAQAGNCIEQRKQFHIAGSLRGTYMDTWTGRLPQDRTQGFLRATDADDFYAVYSHATPIAWYAHGVWTVPNVRYSVTTSKHQNLVRKAVGL